MRDYEQLRRHWMDELDRSGELSALDRDERRLLEEGSLDVFAAVRLSTLQRRRRVSRILFSAAYLVFFGSLAAVVAAQPVPAGTLFFAVLLMLFVAHRFGRGSEERQHVYEHLSRTRQWLDGALREAPYGRARSWPQAPSTSPATERRNFAVMP